jgi:hypothetical protein
MGAAACPTLLSHMRARTQVQVRQTYMLLTLTGLFGGGSGARYSGATGPMTLSGELVGRGEWVRAGRAARANGAMLIAPGIDAVPHCEAAGGSLPVGPDGDRVDAEEDDARGAAVP